MTYDQGLFRELDKTAVSKVRIGNGEYISAKGKETVSIESFSGLKLILDVLFVPNIDQNLLSVGKLLKKGFKVLFEDKFCMIKDANGKDVFKIKMRGKNVALNLLKEEQATVSQENNVTTLLHKRLGHFHHNGVLYMKKNQLAVVADVFWKYKALVENQSGAVIQVIKTDNGTEYTSERFNNLCEEAGIEHQLTAPYTPQQNGVVKRDKLDKKTEAGIFVGYNSQSKTYRVYMPRADKIIVSRDVKFMEDDKWSWDAKKNQNFEFLDENIDDIPVKGTKSLYNIYQRCNVAVFEPVGFNEAVEDKKWRVAITFALIARLDTIRMLLAVAAQKGWKIYQLDVKSTFLNGYLEEEIFVEQPEGFVVKGKEDKVYQLKKALYGLKQAPKAWYNRINAHLLRINQCLMDKFKAEMEEVFEMTYLGDMSYFLGMEDIVAQSTAEAEYIAAAAAANQHFG
ncbi:Retrovirus-related Pol polyprotein from transposon RE2 [Vitis vinifera]|uniref:Retrovirus-related Pol polyprotein from transposon RE2 n=1 Tax=Vitis vinifera TaxID=29760 RepID=A0A438EQR5_VITVI|nr:Retrovirus-related Pol polyprotein from transposon RE2 [Vitis vinifera]